jgi:hypothetical protein
MGKVENYSDKHCEKSGHPDTNHHSGIYFKNNYGEINRGHA